MDPIVVKLSGEQGTFPALSRFSVKMPDGKVVSVSYPITRTDDTLFEYDENSPVWQVKEMNDKELQAFEDYMKEAISGGVYRIVDEGQTHLLSGEDRKGWQKVKEGLKSD